MVFRKRRKSRRNKKGGALHAPKGVKTAPNTAGFEYVQTGYDSLFRGSGTEDNCVTFYLGTVIGHNDFYYKALTAIGQGDSAGSISADITFGNTSSAPEGYANATALFNPEDEKNPHTNALNHYFYFYNIQQRTQIRNVDLNPCYLTVYTCVIRKAVPHFAQGADGLLRARLMEMFWSGKALTKDALDTVNLDPGWFAPTGNYSIASRDRNMSLYKFRDLMEHLFILKKKTFLVGPGQVVTLKQKIAAHYRLGKDCGSELWDPSNFTENTQTSEFVLAFNHWYLNSIAKGIKAKLFVYKVSGFLGSNNADEAGRIAPNIVIEHTKTCKVKATMQTKPMYDVYVSSNTGPFSGPSEFVEQS